ncbi:uncharacterized protein C8A04DRAFT_12707 [Dichotomopilus funicola]|uniref:RRM domain-containing protein n=1 Tax=Dichotomopilus funicola TaxID=1934379 RepID=A0AAN6V1K8_9PEZI|nr:hypothetical protein C8A04DRAFT_12707 [Dichotomopilus funicola]
MSDQSPEVVAAANLTPLSPIPVSPAAAIQSTVVPNLQDQAATTTTNSAADPAIALFPLQQLSTMESQTVSNETPDTIVVSGDLSDGSQDGSDESIDYGEGEEGQKQDKTEPDAANDDYAKTFDSPAAHHEGQNEAEAEVGEHEAAQPDVSMVPESMNSPLPPDSAVALPAVPFEHAPRAPAPAPTAPVPSALSHTNGEAPSTNDLAPPFEQANGSGKPCTPLSPTQNGVPLSSTAPAAASATEDAEKPSPATPTSKTATAASAPPTPMDEDDAAVDIQKLVDDITANAAASDSPPAAPAQAVPVQAPVQAPPASLPVSHPPSLPPKPALPNPPHNLPAIPPTHYSFQSRGHNGSAALGSPSTPHGAYSANDGVSSLHGGFGGASHNNAHHSVPPHSGDGSSQQLWEQFQADEKRYTSEAKWERFPEGSRIFIGNLSSERVSKREVFDVFHQFGRLAQISLKSAYGFVQYHTIGEGHAAMQGVQGIELGGRRIHLEISRTQKKGGDKDRSPDRRGGPRGSHGNERFEGGGDRSSGGWRRDDYRPGRSPSPRRNDRRGARENREGRDSTFSRDREFGGHQRRRSRSPQRFSRYGDDSYRRRSPSPHRRAPSDAGDRFDLPRRFGADVPDVQILLLQEVSRDFVAWVQGAFHNKGLKTDVMYLNPRFPRETVLQRQVVEGVHAIIDLDYGAQAKGKIPIQVFIRSGGSSVRFELYQDVDPPIAAELVAREKSQSATQQAAVQAQAAHALLASLQTPQPGGQPQQQPYPGIPQVAAHAAVGNAAAQIDMNALLGNLRNAAAAQPAVPAPVSAPQYGAPHGYGAHPAGIGPGGYGGLDPTQQQVQTIMDQLKRSAR